MPTKTNDLTNVPAAACHKCGGWASMGGMSQHRASATPVMGRTGCLCMPGSEVPAARRGRTDAGKIRELIRKACEANGVPEIAQRIVVKWSERYTSCMGTAAYRGKFDMTVTFSGPLWPRADEAERTNTIVHEACHIIAFYKAHGYFKITAHGPEWKRCMRRAGYQPTRCHTVDNSGLTKARKKYAYTCACQRTHQLGATRHKRAQNGSVYRCNRCKQNIQLKVDKAVVGMVG